MSHRILVADDEPAVRRLLCRFLSAGGYAVSNAATGDEALKRALAEEPDLILLDKHMPGKGGLEVLAELRRDDRTRGIPVILVTGDGAPDAEVRGLEGGPDDYVRKPFFPEELTARVAGLLQQVRGNMAPHAQRPASADQLPAGIAHNVNNMLTSVLGIAYLLRAGGELPESVRPDLDVIIDQSERAARLVRQLLDFTRPQSAQESKTS